MLLNTREDVLKNVGEKKKNIDFHSREKKKYGCQFFPTFFKISQFFLFHIDFLNILPLQLKWMGHISILVQTCLETFFCSVEHEGRHRALKNAEGEKQPLASIVFLCLLWMPVFSTFFKISQKDIFVPHWLPQFFPTSTEVNGKDKLLVTNIFECFTLLNTRVGREDVLKNVGGINQPLSSLVFFYSNYGCQFFSTFFKIS